MFQVSLSLILQMTCCATASIISIDESKPWLSSGEAQLRFMEGGPAYMLASYPLVRVNYRGVKVSRKTPNVLDLENVGNWQSVACNASAYALCSTHGKGSMFPVSAAPLFTSSSPLRCADSKAKSLVSNVNFSDSFYYDVSACDVLDEGFDVVIAAAQLVGTVWIRSEAVSQWVYWTLILCTIFLIRTVSLNLMDKLKGNNSGDDAKPIPQHRCIAVNAVILLVVAFQGDTHYVTAEDAAFYYVTIVYISAYLAFHLYHALQRWRRDKYQQYFYGPYHEPRVFNLSAASLQLVIMRLYCGVESPYVVAIACMLLVRVWDKEAQKLWMHSITALLDCMYVALLLQWGYAYDPLYLIPLVAFTKLAADKMFL